MDEIAKKHHATAGWGRVIDGIRQEMVRRKVHAAQTVVLVPYAQLMLEARQAWATALNVPGFVPRFETTMNWTRSLGGFVPDGDDLRMDPARDVLTAASLLARAGMAPQKNALAGRLMAAAWSLARLAASVAPHERLAWGTRMATGLTTDMAAPVLELDARLGRIALAWAASSSYPTDRVFTARAELVVVLEGFQSEPLAQALHKLWGDRVVALELDTNGTADTGAQPHERSWLKSSVSLHAALDLQDEAHRAAACVLAHLAAGRSPVALVAQDRVLTRQVRALLGERGVAVRDETGWKLSTTRAAAGLMGLLRACVWDASTDAVLDWLKNASAFEPGEVVELEAGLRKAGTRDWLQVLATDGIVQRVQLLREALQPGRSLAAWLRDVRAALESAGQWAGLNTDPAGEAVLTALSLREGADAAFADVAGSLSLNDLTTWASQTLEAASFLPAHPAQAQVVILPLSQLLGRALPAVVLPGCDEMRMPVAPEPPDNWTPAQREWLGLPARAELTAALRSSWQYALKSPWLDVLWRTSEGGERLMPSGFVQAMLLQNAANPGDSAIAPMPDPRVLRELQAQPSSMSRPVGQALTISRLSASAYDDLRSCPYRFFALRQLKLQEDDELDTRVSKRDFGTWLHSLLGHFQEALKITPEPDLHGRVAMINVASVQATTDLGLSDAEFLPFAASWPRVRDGYLEWLAKHEATGASFDQSEVQREMPVGAVTLTGRIDRIDHNADGSVLVIDYKTESDTQTRERIKGALEDTQLAFYAALLSDDTLAAAYVNVGEKDGTHTHQQHDIVVLRDHLLEGIQHDMGRVASGAGMPALGEGKACEYCAARGLCRKDFWEERPGEGAA